MSAGYGGPGGGGYGGGGGYPPGAPGAPGQPPGGQPPGGYGPPGGGGAFGQPPAAPPGGGGAFGQPPGAPGGGSYGPPGGAPPGGAFGPPAGGGAYGPPGGAPPGGAFGQPQGGAFGAPPGGAFGAGDPNASQGSVGEMFANFGLLAKRSLSGIAWVYVLFAAISFLFITLPQSLIGALRMEAIMSDDPLLSLGLVTGLGYLTTVLAIVGGLLVGTLQSGLSRAARIALVDGPTALGGFGGALKASYARFVPVMGCLLLYGVGIFIGSLLCLLPGLAVAYLGMAGVYLCASKDEGAWDALMHSGRLTTKYIGPCAVLVVVAIVVGGILLGVNLGLAALFVSVLGMWGTFTSTLIVTLLGIPVGYLMWLLGMATFATIETAESQVAISK